MYHHKSEFKTRALVLGSGQNLLVQGVAVGNFSVPKKVLAPKKACPFFLSEKFLAPSFFSEKDALFRILTGTDMQYPVISRHQAQRNGRSLKFHFSIIFPCRFFFSKKKSLPFLFLY